MSNQVPVWFWRRMRRVMADQESRGGNTGDSSVGKDGSSMRVNLAEGCGAVNATPWRVEREARERRDLKFEVPIRRISDIEPSRLARPASFTCLAVIVR